MTRYLRHPHVVENLGPIIVLACGLLIGIFGLAAPDFYALIWGWR